MSERSGGFTIWITGLPFSGKKLLASQVKMRLEAIGLEAEILEGGQIRRRFEDRLGFTREQVAHNLARIGFEAELLAEAGKVAVVVAISPFRDHREDARRKLGRFVEVYCRCPLEVLEQRDRRGFYARARTGQIENVAGVSYPYEPSELCEVTTDTDRESPEDGAQKVLAAAERMGFIRIVDHSVLTREEEEALRRRLRDSFD